MLDRRRAMRQLDPLVILDHLAAQGDLKSVSRHQRHPVRSTRRPGRPALPRPSFAPVSRKASTPLRDDRFRATRTARGSRHFLTITDNFRNARLTYV
ncbi:hypothetical protein [Sphingomonas sp. Ant20]|uniref:hypothetical protein n=1 Tax=Sphingomonas sp. Ant20 TaxID=104605 RepID=UPI000FE13BD8|nr:hypothetical protein [Sphingomonas sp. Ant20]